MPFAAVPLASLVVLGAGLAALFLLRDRARRPARHVPDREPNLFEVAYLFGGPPRVVDAALVAMVDDGLIRLSRSGVVRPIARAPRNAVEKAIVAEIGATGHGRIDAVRAAAMRTPDIERIGASLVARGLLVSPGTGVRLRAAAGILACLAIVGLVATLVAAVPDPAAGPLVAAMAPLLVITVALVVIWLRPGVRHTVYGAARCRELRDPARNPLLATRAGEVALNGLDALPDPALRAALRRRPRPRRRATVGAGTAGRTFPWWYGGTDGGSAGHHGGGHHGGGF